MKAVFLDLHGLRTRYLIAGGGPLLMLIHPVGYPAEIFAGTSTNWRAITPWSRRICPGRGIARHPPGGRTRPRY